MGWRVIHITEGEYLSCMLDNLKVSTADKEDILIPLSDIHSLVIDNYKLKLTSQLITRCSENNVALIVCSVDHRPTTIVLPQSGNYQGALVLRKQLRWSKEQKSTLHSIIIEGKISNQINACKICKIDEEEINFKKLTGYITQIEESDITNREGLAAKVYFGLMFGTDFRRFDNTVVNAALNYGYSILRSQISKSIVAKGLHPAIGIFHIGPENMFNLSDDIIEPFRPIVDIWVKENIQNSSLSEFTKEHRQELLRLTSITKVIIDNKTQTLFNAMDIMVDSISQYFENGCVPLLPTIKRQ